MATPNTNKNSLTLPIGALAVLALVAGPRRVTSVYSFKLDTLLARNVRHLQEERRERPSVVNQSSLFGDPDSGSNALEIFDDYRPGAGLQGFINDPICHIPEQPINRPLLFARQPFQEPSLASALVPCGLKIAALFESALSNVLDYSALENLAGTGRGYTNDPGIHTNARITLSVWNILCEDQMQIPDSPLARDCGRRLDFPRPVEILPVVIGEDQINSDSAANRGQRGVLLIEFYCQRSSVVSHRRCLFPSVALFFFSLVCFRNYIASGANEIGGKRCHLSYVTISDVVKRDRVKGLLLKGNLRSVIEGDHIRFLRIGKGLRSLFSHLKFYLQRESRLHIGRLISLKPVLQKRIALAKPPRNADFLCRL
jgi:hypothetical protein